MSRQDNLTFCTRLTWFLENAKMNFEADEKGN